MKPKFKVRVTKVEVIHELPFAWTPEELQDLLELADFEDWDEIEEQVFKNT